MSDVGDKSERPPRGRRSGQDGDASSEASHGDDGNPAGAPTNDDPREITGGAAVVDPNIDGFKQPTAMFDKGEFLGELADLVDGAPDTRARVEAEAEPPKGCRLIIVAGPDLGLEWGFKAKEIIIGRDEDCQLVMSDIAVSRRHARIAFEGDHFVLTDLSSGNGTFLNGVRIQKERLSPGDEIIIGERTLRFVELNEAPATSAAQPVPPEASAPAVSDVSGPSGDFEPLLKSSKVSVEDGKPVPDPDSGELPVPDGLPTASGDALRRTAVGFAAVAGFVAICAAGWLLYERYFSGETPAEREVRVKREFLQGVELVKQLRCGDASILFRRVLLAAPTHPRAPDYLAHCESQLAHWSHISAARDMAAARRYIEAIDRLREVPKDSDYGPQAVRDREVYARSIAYSLLEEAQDGFEARQFDKAIELVDRALELAPDLTEARQLRRRIADATAAPKRPRRSAPKFSVPRSLRRAVALYREGKVGSAIDAAEAVGGDPGPTWAARMKTVNAMLDRASVAHRAKAAGELLRIGPEALDLDQKIAGGQGKVRRRLSKYYADGLYLKGIEALQASDDVSAYRLLTRTTKIWPEHQLARSQLRKLSGKAREIYYEGYVLKEQDRAKTRKLFQRLTQITPQSNPYHRLAVDWLRVNR